MTFIIELKSKTPAVSRVECIASCAKPISTLGILKWPSEMAPSVLPPLWSLRFV